MLQERQTSIVSDVDAFRQPDFVIELGLLDDKMCPFGEAAMKIPKETVWMDSNSIFTHS